MRLFTRLLKYVKKVIILPLDNELDLLIKASATSKKVETTGYMINGKLNNRYIENDAWNIFVNNMTSSARTAFSEGSGDELGIKKIGNKPPKMACYGSSSRMIYLASRDIPNFKFEEKLPTTVGGTAHMDGYLEKDNHVIYIEAKCREPYSQNSYIIDRKYEALYRYIEESPEVNLKCEITILNEKKMKVAFVANGTELTRFDIKQMICHLLGIATRHLKTQSDKAIRFIYFLYNPKHLEITDDNLKQRIYDVYDTEIKECDSIPFDSLFRVILRYLQGKIDSNLDIEKCANEFIFKLCDQTTYINEISNI